MPIENQSVQGIEGLLQAVLGIAKDLPDGRFLWFRGLSCGYHKLIPKIMRDNRPSDEVFDRERRLITRFRQRSIAYWPTGYPQSDWEQLFAMQHYGMPTRLLDWSENLFVASHFALSEPSMHSHDGACTPVIWCVDPIEWNRSVPLLSDFGDAIQVLTTADEDLDSYRPETTKKRSKSPVAMFGTHNSARIVAQRGTFMVWGCDPKPLEDFADQQSAKLWRIEVQGNQIELAKSLRHLGFSETMVFPELPSLSIELSRTEGWKS